jgi:hypothetical protein
MQVFGNFYTVIKFRVYFTSWYISTHFFLPFIKKKISWKHLFLSNYKKVLLKLVTIYKQ